ncbi:MAG TPA: ferredoxin oxidoreductase [Candidatus Magasanikbacteria bacterium]|uniref:2-oxoglutarate ferredoxin oxidoreductase, alpha subunit n=1 Tax=Candidatus Magasanikbacteria bacterium GW2011_GWC2_41_17 TaxID=1619048 RepID=A0A0G0VHP2_9BACT|nr:MAG: 2-oxoglutarate ferredoxin oxidoreductase, alpha subunit [Candidatus Magasanikbacteria bacterium GW2011_GWC2_41_17]HBV58100.1 ferredoxin oxidoreductase [Candidatus Magasanikbacteria bacterium]HBX16028.1 ferredoxin oxidoreductase [Candidatus Magasanikbacteria bacterium]
MYDVKKKFMTGAEIATQAAIDFGADTMYGYPITPVTEVFTNWIKQGQKYLQTEDEIAAGFAVCGAVMAGQKAFTATSGPGHILMQDALSMAEGMRLPFVAIVAQRGGPSSGTVIYSQQETTLACFGGNGEGLRLVYSPGTLAELYTLIRRAFNESWQYRFPAIILTDGYTVKTRGLVDLENLKVENVASAPLVKEGEIKHWPNIFTFEEELYTEVMKSKADFDKITAGVATAEEYQTEDAEILLIAHGIVGAATKVAVDQLREADKKVGLFRPITLRPLAVPQLNSIAKKVKKIVFIESSLGQLARIIKDELSPGVGASFEYLQCPGLGIEIEEIVNQVSKF